MENVSLFYGKNFLHNETQTELIHATEDSQNSIPSVSTPNYYTYDYSDLYDDYKFEYKNYNFSYGDVYIYPLHSFEKQFYLYIWGILVIFTSLVNFVVIFVFLRRKMRYPTSIVLATIAVSDSLTGLVTLPIYIMVFLRNYPVQEYLLNDYAYGLYGEHETKAYNDSYFEFETGLTAEPLDGYILTKDLCLGLIISKFFLSKCFYSVSIFLTLFLVIQRYIAVTYPYKSRFLFNMKRTLICSGVIFVISPILHIYHLLGEKAVDGLCQSTQKENPNRDENNIYFWFSLFIVHFMPCIVLIVFTVLFIYRLRVRARTLSTADDNNSQLSRREEENRRMSLVVTAIAIVFLIPEMPYVMVLFYNDLKQNRTIGLVYELFIVLAFHAKFYIYTIFNRRFRKTLYRTFCKPFFSLFTNRQSNRENENRGAGNRFEMENTTAGPDESRVRDILHEGTTLPTKLKDDADTDV